MCILRDHPLKDFFGDTIEPSRRPLGYYPPPMTWPVQSSQSLQMEKQVGDNNHQNSVEKNS